MVAIGMLGSPAASGAGRHGRRPLTRHPAPTLHATVPQELRCVDCSGSLRHRARIAATFWLLNAPDSLAAQSRREPDGVGLGVFERDGNVLVRNRPIAAYQDVQFARQVVCQPCGRVAQLPHRRRRGRGWHTATVTETVVWVSRRHGYRSRHSSDRRRRDPDVRRARYGGRSRSACGRLGSDAHRRGRARAVPRVLESAPSYAPRRGATLGLRQHHPTAANTACLAVHIPAGPRPTDCRRSTSPRRRQCASQW
jgi:hypothetical protein